MFYGMLNDRLLYKKAIRTLGKGKSDLASKFTNYYQVEALKLVNKDNYSKALLFDTEDKVRVLKILGDEDIKKTIYIAEIVDDLRSLDRHNWIALEYLKNHKFIEYAFSYNGEYKIRSLVELGRDNADLAYKFDSETRYNVLNLIGAYRNKPQKIFKIASEFEMLDYDSSQYIEAFYKLERCVKNNECKSKCINEIDNNLNFIDCFKDLEVDHQDL